jgi:hypothetical protein
MNQRARQLAMRQQLLLLRSAELRRDFIEQAAVWQTPLSLADRVHQGWQWLRAHPQAVAAGAVTLAVMRPRRAWRWGMRLWWGWRLWQRLQRAQHGLMPPPRAGGPRG